MGAKSSESCLIEMQSVGEVSEVILISKLKPGFSVWYRKLNPLSLKHNKAFKRDSCRVAFLVCGEFWW